jgi:hypothetical protein
MTASKEEAGIKTRLVVNGRMKANHGELPCRETAHCDASFAASHSRSIAFLVTPRSGIPSFSHRHTVDLSTPKCAPISSWVHLRSFRSFLRSIVFCMWASMHNAHRPVKSKRTPKTCFTHYYD